MNAIALCLLAVITTAQNTKNDRPVVYGYQSGQKCPAQAFYNDCNSCKCRPNGVNAVCTEIGCLAPVPGTDSSKPLYTPDYEPGDACPAKYFYDGYNRCFCNDDGVTAGCTKIFWSSNYV